MPYTVYEKLGLGESKATRISLELADRSIQYPRGIIENVLIKVDKFVLLIDFIILDMPEDSRVPIILGRPLWQTASSKPPTKEDECYGIDDLDDTINAEAQELLANEEPDSFLSRGLEKSIDQSDLEVRELVEYKTNSDSDSDEPIRHIMSINTLYLVAQETLKSVEVERKHLYSASANEIDGKKPELKDLPHHLEYYTCMLQDDVRAFMWNEYYYFLDGFSGFFQIPIAPEDQEKTTFTCPSWTFANDECPKQDAKPRLIRWVLLLQGFDIEIKDKRGAKNLAADHLSRLENPDFGTFTEEKIADEFLDEHLIVLKTEVNNDEPWYADYVSYLVGKIVPSNWTPE
ncbi:reverse transcriptase domain-containing protein [Tanacetum coccineum]